MQLNRVHQSNSMHSYPSFQGLENFELSCASSYFHYTVLFLLTFCVLHKSNIDLCELLVFAAFNCFFAAQNDFGLFHSCGNLFTCSVSFVNQFNMAGIQETKSLLWDSGISFVKYVSSRAQIWTCLPDWLTKICDPSFLVECAWSYDIYLISVRIVAVIVIGYFSISLDHCFLESWWFEYEQWDLNVVSNVLLKLSQNFFTTPSKLHIARLSFSHFIFLCMVTIGGLDSEDLHSCCWLFEIL